MLSIGSAENGERRDHGKRPANNFTSGPMRRESGETTASDPLSLFVGTDEKGQREDRGKAAR